MDEINGRHAYLRELLSLDDYLAIPYVLRMETIDRGTDVVRRASFPELDGLMAEAEEVHEVIAKLEDLRVMLIFERFQAHQEIPIPRPPLRHPRIVEALIG